MRGGLELSFEGKGITVVLLTLIPQFAEASCAAFLSHYILGLPMVLSYALGFCLGAVSPAVLVPSVMILQRANYGTKKGIPTTMIAASSFDDIIAITVYSVLVTVAYEQIGVGSSTGEAMTSSEMIVNNLVQIFSGIVGGLLIGASFRILNSFTCLAEQALDWVKFFLMLSVAIATPVLTHIIHFHEAKYIGIIFFGYACFRVWGEDKPEHKLAQFWKIC